MDDVKSPRTPSAWMISPVSLLANRVPRVGQFKRAEMVYSCRAPKCLRRYGVFGANSSAFSIRYTLRAPHHLCSATPICSVVSTSPGSREFRSTQPVRPKSGPVVPNTANLSHIMICSAATFLDPRLKVFFCKRRTSTRDDLEPGIVVVDGQYGLPPLPEAEFRLL